MILHIATITNTWSPLIFKEPKKCFPVLAELEEAEGLTFGNSIDFQLSTRMTGTQVEIKGELSYGVTHTCGRCLTPFEEAIQAELSINFVDSDDLHDETDTEEEIELTEDTITSESYSGETIDLSHSLQDEVIMALPQSPLCGGSCKGLCKVCGQNLNKKACGCDTHVPHPAFAKLKVLQGGKE